MQSDPPPRHPFYILYPLVDALDSIHIPRHHLLILRSPVSRPCDQLAFSAVVKGAQTSITANDFGLPQPVVPYFDDAPLEANAAAAAAADITADVDVATAFNIDVDVAFFAFSAVATLHGPL